MDSHRHLPLTALAAMALISALAIVLGGELRFIETPGLRTELPARLGPWSGEIMLYCRNPECLKEWKRSELADTDRCPSCSGELDTASPVERNTLPADTLIAKATYQAPDAPPVHVSIVLSGSDRTSIHRPQVCLVYQGQEVVRSRVISIPTGARREPRVMLLDLRRRVRLEDGRVGEFATYYAYWFSGLDRETPYHAQRMVWMATDQIFRGVTRRWGYIAVMGLRTPGDESYVEQVRQFVALLHPALHAPEP